MQNPYHDCKVITKHLQVKLSLEWQCKVGNTHAAQQNVSYGEDVLFPGEGILRSTTFDT